MKNRYILMFTLLTLVIVLFISSCKKDEPPTSSTIDNTAPFVLITYPAQGAILASSVNIAIEATDNIGVKYVECFIDGVFFSSDSTAPYSIRWDVGFWADGNTHTILVKAIDLAGNIGISNLISVIVSTTASNTPVLISPADNSYSDSTVVNFAWTKIDSAVSYTLQISKTEDFSTLEFSKTLTDTFTTSSNLSQSRFFARVNALNSSGKISAWSKISLFAIPRLFGGSYSGKAIRQSVYGNLFVLCFNWNGGISLQKFSLNGEPLWEKTFSYPYTLESASFDNSLLCTSDGGCVFVAEKEPTNDNYGIFVKVNSNGDIEWEREYNRVERTSLRSVQDANNGCYILAGTISSSLSYSEGLLIKTDKFGNSIWEKTIPDLSQIQSADQTQDGGFILSGANNFLIKTDSLGAVLWNRSVIGGFDGTLTSDGGYILAGRTSSVNLLKDILIQKFNSTGNLTWSQEYGQSTGIDVAYSIKQTINGGYVIAGRSDLNPTSVLVIRLDQSGNQLWSCIFSRGYGISIYPISDGSFIISGSGGAKLWLMHIDSSGRIIW